VVPLLRILCGMQEPQPLPETDKRSSGLDRVYLEMFKEFRDRPVRLLEIGIRRGGSMWLWAEIFPHPESLFIGLDLFIPEAPLPANAKAFVCNQNDRAGLQQIAQQFGPFDVIIDDGNHYTKETRTTFETLFFHTKIGGIYVIEDWACGYWKDNEPGYQGMVQTITDLVQQAPSISIDALTISLKPNQAYAAFRRGAQGWTS
jgi:hypothetical protein